MEIGDPRRLESRLIVGWHGQKHVAERFHVQRQGQANAPQFGGDVAARGVVNLRERSVLFPPGPDVDRRQGKDHLAGHVMIAGIAKHVVDRDLVDPDEKVFLDHRCRPGLVKGEAGCGKAAEAVIGRGWQGRGGEKGYAKGQAH